MPSDALRSFLPWLDLPRHDAEQRVRLRTHDVHQSRVGLRVANGQLRHEMAPLVIDLPARHRHRLAGTQSADLVRRERIAARCRFRVNRTQVVSDDAPRRSPGPEAHQLRVMSVAGRLPRQDRLRQ